MWRNILLIMSRNIRICRSSSHHRFKMLLKEISTTHRPSIYCNILLKEIFYILFFYILLKEISTTHRPSIYCTSMPGADPVYTALACLVPTQYILH